MSRSVWLLGMLCILIQPSIIPAQSWIARYSSPDSASDIANDIVVDNMGNIYITGQSVNSGTFEDYVTVKYDSLGEEQWVAIYNGPSNDVDEAYEVALDDAGNIYVTGKSNGNSFDYATVKYDSLGNELWVARYHYDWQDAAYALAIDNHSNVYVTGVSSDCYATIKYDSLGNQKWVKRYNGYQYISRAYDIAVDNCSNVYVTGEDAANMITSNYATIKYDSLGNQKWVKFYPGAACAIALDTAGNICVTGSSPGFLNRDDYATIKYDSSGIQCWVARFDGGSENGVDRARAIAVDSVGNVYVTGETWADWVVPHRNYATIKYNTHGSEEWVAIYNYNYVCDDYANDIAVDNTGNVYVTGCSNGDYATVKYDSMGNELWVRRYDGTGSSSAHAVTLDFSSNIYVTGQSTGLGTWYDYLTIKYPATTAIVERKAIPIENKKISSTVFSGPPQLPEGTTYKIFDIIGRQIHTLDPAPGIYFIEINGRVVHKVIKVR